MKEKTQELIKIYKYINKSKNGKKSKKKNRK